MQVSLYHFPQVNVVAGLDCFDSVEMYKNGFVRLYLLSHIPKKILAAVHAIFFH